jgi:hypothetical protein
MTRSGRSKTTLRTRVLLVLAALVVIGLTAVAVGWLESRPADATPSDISPANEPDTARKQLAELEVRPGRPMAGYSRESFPHWASVEGRCDAREAVLKRDGQDVVVDGNCRVVSGRWVSPYDGGVWTEPTDVDIDHLVPLANAWRSGAGEWSRDKRREFANDMVRPQLIAVTDNVNQAKGDQGPDTWKPPLTSTWCGYSVNWIAVKHHYGLSVNDTEKTELAKMLDRC